MASSSVSIAPECYEAIAVEAVSSFRRSPSHVFFESDLCTSPTSWEFCAPRSGLSLVCANSNSGGQQKVKTPTTPLDCHREGEPISILTSTSPLPMRLSLLRVSGTETSVSKGGSGSGADLGADGSRNSSSTGSHRSQDSGFSDSGETRKRVGSGSGSGSGIGNNGSQHSDHLNHSQSQSPKVLEANQSDQIHIINKSDLYPFPYIDQSLTNSPYTSLQMQKHKKKQQQQQQMQVQYYPSPSQKPNIANGQKIQHHHHQNHNNQHYSNNNNNNNSHATYIPFPNDTNSPHPNQNQNQHENHNHNQNETSCANCIYQEVILAQSVNANASISTLSPQSCHLTCCMDQSVVDLGAPTCASTPKRVTHPHLQQQQQMTHHYNNNNLNHRPTVMTKIDNFESLNKNQKSLDDNNNNSNNPSSHSNKESFSSQNGQNYETVRNLNGNSHFHSRSNSNPNPNANSGTNSKSHSRTNSTSTISIVSSSTATVKKISGTNSNSNSPSRKALSVYSSTNNNINPPAQILENGDSIHHNHSHSYSQNQNQNQNHLENQNYQHHHQHHRQSSEDWNDSSVSKSTDYSSRVNICSSPKVQSLPRGFRRVHVNGNGHAHTHAHGHASTGERNCEQVIVKKSPHDNDAMRLWLHELRGQAEPECLYTLQSKAIDLEDETGVGVGACSSRSRSRDGPFSHSQHAPGSSATSPTPLNVTTLAIHSVSAPLLSIRNVEEMASIISGEFSKICKHLEFGFFAQVPSLVETLADLLDEFLRHFKSRETTLHKLENRLGTSTYELRLAAHALNDLILSSSGIQMQQENEHGNEHGNGYGHGQGFYHGAEGNSADLSYSYLGSPPSVSSPLSQADTSALNPNQNMNMNQNRTMYAVVGHEHEQYFHRVVGEIVENIVLLGNLFGQVVDQRLTRDLSSILETIENGGLPSRVALKSFAAVLSDGGTHICSLAASIRTVRGLLGVLLDAKDDHSKILALRCLATLLCIGEAVKDFDRAGGFEIIADILFDPLYSNTIKYEAVACTVQVTDPWLDLETTLVNLGFHLEKIISSLTNLIPQCKGNDDIFLLLMAAISNLTFLEVSSVDILRRYRTISLIINAVEENSSYSIFILDHVATILANMASSESCRKDIVSSGGIQALHRFLQYRSTHLESASEIAACERLQQKSTIAISRLCNEDGVAQMFIEMNGMQRMIQLCRQEKERWYSDGVLLACLATLRKLVTAVSGNGGRTEAILKGLHAQDLIEPRLLDSFLLYSSSRQESYV